MEIPYYEAVGGLVCRARLKGSMETQEIYHEFTIFHRVFNDDSIVVRRDLTANYGQ